MIGVTTYREIASTGVWTVPAAFLPASYLDSVTRAGGVAVLLPPQPTSPAIVARVLEGLDGLVCTGGRDIDPARYGKVRHPQTDSPRHDRDAWEAELLSQAIARDLPFLGICRGAQLLNVVCRGTLHQHVPDIVGTESYRTGDGVYGSVSVDVAPGSRLHALIGTDAALPTPAQVAVYHHQAIDELGADLTVTARAADGIVQAIELAGATFGIAVQWHPEEQADDIRLFVGLVTAAATYRARKETNQAPNQAPLTGRSTP
ncbi:gamma-glutamyl-gamma-aminobutyrate hydrolase family protein [Cryobacterium melibiosiphilum]|uniref:Gamma-glutamyl-gamma-aminobutyrate hydrolase family protein n=1 Tax=Cryobacterium melibiosiphilum TaxID=995039 RepID=A0A3A5MKN4_9MICO|nr:gamma-glutamyl-gamma-aminobutyrate hydrolase family protein [Cryobacterium melibiosiphilum]